MFHSLKHPFFVSNPSEVSVEFYHSVETEPCVSIGHLALYRLSTSLESIIWALNKRNYLYYLSGNIMSASEIKQKIDNAVKDAMRARDKQRVGALRLTMSEFKKIEVDERIELDDARVLAILDKMTKQRKDSLAQYEAAGREDLVAQEAFEIELIKEFLPTELTVEELAALVQGAISETGASSMKDMGRVMAILKPQIQGRADVGAVSGQVKSLLS